MKNFWENYKQSILILAGILIGGIFGLIFKENISVVNPLGTIFLNLMFVAVVPLIFLTLSVSIAKMKEPKRLGKIFRSTIIVFVITSIISVSIAFFTVYNINLVNVEDQEGLLETLSTEEEEDAEEINILEAATSVLTVNDFYKLLSKDNLLALLITSILVGISINMAKEKGEKLLEILESANHVMSNFIKLIMYYAPIGLGAYFAVFIGTFGPSIGTGFLKTFLIYTGLSIIFFVVAYSLYAYIAGGKKGVVTFWKNVIPVLAVSLSTCSSAASIPVNVETVKKMGVSNDIAETVVPLGTSFHKDGSIIGSVFKVMFLVSLFGTTIVGFGGILDILFVSLLATLLVVGIPIGGGTISEMLIISMLGYPMTALPFLTIVATIIDAPATVLNVSGDTSSSMLVARLVDGKDWQQN